MAKTFKRALAVVLTVLMLVGAGPMNVFAEDLNTDTAASSQEEIILVPVNTGEENFSAQENSEKSDMPLTDSDEDAEEGGEAISPAENEPSEENTAPGEDTTPDENTTSDEDEAPDEDNEPEEDAASDDGALPEEREAPDGDNASEEDTASDEGALPEEGETPDGDNASDEDITSNEGAVPEVGKTPEGNTASEENRTSSEESSKTEELPAPGKSILKSPAKSPAKAPSNNEPVRAAASKPISILLKDFDGNTLPSSEIGSGFDLVFYEFPASVAEIDVSSSQAFSNVNYFLNYRTNLVSQYKRTVQDKITSQRTDLVLNMESDASPENPYILCFIGEDGLGMDSALSKEWQSSALIWYDGSEIHNFSNTDERSQVIYNETTKRYDFSVYHDDSLFFPKIKVSFDTADYKTKTGATDADLYPITVSADPVSQNPNIAPSSGISITADGDAELTLSKKISRKIIEGLPENTYVPIGALVSVTDSHSEAFWSLANSSEFPNCIFPIQNNRWVSNMLSFDENGYITDPENPSEQVVLKLKRTVPEGIKPSVLIRFDDPTNATSEEDFPLYVTITANDYDENAGTWYASKTIEISAEDLNREITVSFDSYDPFIQQNATRDLYFGFNFYKDSSYYEYNENWGYGGQYSASCSNVDTGSTVWKDPYHTWMGNYYKPGPVEIYFSCIKPTIPVSVNASDPDLFPAYLKVDAFGQSKVLKIEGNGDLEIPFDRVTFSDFYSNNNVTWTVYSDASCTVVHPGWDIRNKSQYVTFNGQEIVVNENPFAIILNVISTSKLTVPMNTELGTLDGNTFFPVYQQATLHCDGDTFTPVTVVRRLDSLADANKPLEFTAADGEKFKSSDNNIRIDVHFFWNEALTQSAQNTWSDAYEADYFKPFSAELLGDGKLHQGIDELILMYRPLTVDVKPDLYKVDPTKVTANVWLSGYNGMEISEYYGRLSGTDTFTVSFNHLAYVGEEFGACSALLEDGMANIYAETSEHTRLYQYNEDGVVSTTGALKLSDGARMVLKPFESPNILSRVNIPVHLNIPDDGQYDFFHNNPVAFASLSRINPATGEPQYVSYSPNWYNYGYYNNGVDNDSYAYCFVNAGSMTEANGYRNTIRVDIRDGETPYVPAGTYYLSYGVANRWDQRYASKYSLDYGWTWEDNVKVILHNDGTLTFENGDPVELELFYTRKKVASKVDILAEYPPQYQSEEELEYHDDYTPSYVYYYLSPLTANGGNGRTVYLRSDSFDEEGHRIQNIPDGQITRTSPGTLQVGDYTLRYFAAYYYGNHTPIEGWEQDEIRVHLSEDGMIYKVNDDGTCETDPFVIPLRRTADSEREFDSIKIKVHTTIQDGVDASRAFTENDTFAALLSEWHHNGYNRVCSNTRFAVGTAKITETSTIEFEFKNPDGGKLTIKEGYEYNIQHAGTFHNSEINSATFPVGVTANKAWSYYPHFQGTIDDYSLEFPSYFTALNIDDEGYVKGFTYDADGNYQGRSDDAQGDVLIFENKSYILPWEGTDPSFVNQSNANDKTVFKPIKSLSAVKEKGNYIFVVHNEYDDKWYALSCDEAGGYSVQLADVSSFEDLEAGYYAGTSSDFQKMIFTANISSLGSDSISLKLKTNYTSGGKIQSLKMGESSDIPTPLISGSAGTVMLRNDGEYKFSITKGNYSFLWYVDEMFGWKGFRTVSNKYGPWYVRDESDGELVLFGLSNSIGNDWVLGENPIRYNYSERGAYVGVADREYPGTYDPRNKFMLDINTDDYLKTSEYMDKLSELNLSFPGYGQTQFYILSDDWEEEEEPPVNNKYTLVKTYGDFNETFVKTDKNGAAGSNMVLVYEDAEGNEFAMDPKGLEQVATKAGGSGYRTLMTVADHEMIPNNSSGTSAKFSVASAEIKNEGIYVFATDYAFRKSRQNNAVNMEYLTLKSTAWAKNDDTEHGANLKYVLWPSETISSEADWDRPVSYRLSVVRGGVASWLGIAADENGVLQMVTVSSESEAASFKIYSNQLKRYYSSANGTDLYKYYRVYNLTDINQNDEILIVYNDDGQKKIIGKPFMDGSYFPAVNVLDSYSSIDIRDTEVEAGDRYNYRLGTTEYIKKPYAYQDSEEAIIFAQGISANAIGEAEKEGPTQRKYKWVSPLGDQNYYMYIKTGKYVYGRDKAQTNFFPGDQSGEFFIRGGSQDAWLGKTTYQRSFLNLETGDYEFAGEFLTFITVNQSNRIPVEVYRRPASEEEFTVEYHNAQGESDHSEKKPQDTFSLRQNADETQNDTEYIFVGWSTDPAMAGYLTLQDSANLYDYDDLSNVAGLRKEKKEQFSLLGDCNPDTGSLIDYDEVQDFVVDGVLKVYPVYAVRGFSSAVTADEVENGTNRMIVGASDFKDLQNANNGMIDPKERWLGSINVEVYRDGGTWAPGGSTTGRRRGPTPITATLYFAYHNDDAADLNIKFIKDGTTAETLYEYMSSDDFSQAEPSHEYLIDAVYAEQGGSEDGLKYKYNWLDKVVGGQLDNVKGGSTVKIFVTTKYQVKYYFDDDADGNYEELSEGTIEGEDYTWTDEGFYTTRGTANAIEAEEENAEYVVTEENDLKRLLIREDTDDGSRFKDKKIERGEYSVFLYKFNDYEHTFHVAELPEAGEGFELDSDHWSIRDEDLAEVSTADPDTDYTVTETTYGTGNSVYSYQNDSLNDTTNTYHLYIRVRSLDSTDIEITKVWDDAENQDGIRLTAEEFASKIHLMKGETEVKGFEPVVTDNEDGTYTVLFEGMPKSENDKEIVYTVKEDEIEGYEADKTEVGDGGVITNTHMPETTRIEITKDWDDAEDQDGIRPTAEEFVSMIHLMKDGEECPDYEATVTDNGDGTYTVSFEGMPKFESGEEIAYTVKEDEIEDYEADETEAENGGTITNTHTPETTRIEITKVWDDAEDQDGIRPTSEEFASKIHLMKGETEIKEFKPVVTDNEDGTYTVSYEDIPKFEKGKEIVYTVKEDEIEGYEADETEVQDGGTITNKHTPEPYGSLKIIKTLDRWENASAATFVFDITARIDGKEVYTNVAAFTFTSAGTKEAVFDQIPVGSEVTVTEIYSGSSYKATGSLERMAKIEAFKVASVSFENDYDGRGKHGYGIQNTFTYSGESGEWAWSKE